MITDIPDWIAFFAIVSMEELPDSEWHNRVHRLWRRRFRYSLR